MFPIALRREIIVLLLVKAALLTALYAFFFSPSHRIEPTLARMQSHLLNDTR
ncbi:MAG TPA: hypothetical protein VLW75_03765 [Rhizomicrobium sp.]|nr:hypothetical protein [Rhizomicrobium sp.]